MVMNEQCFDFRQERCNFSGRRTESVGALLSILHAVTLGAVSLLGTIAKYLNLPCPVEAQFRVWIGCVKVGASMLVGHMKHPGGCPESLEHKHKHLKFLEDEC
jgi:hypothetical protein